MTRPKITIHNALEIRKMQHVSSRLFRILEELQEQRLIGEPGIVIERFIKRSLKRYGFTSAMEFYRGYPSAVSVSINDIAVHGLPGSSTVNRGDVFSVDIAARFDGFVGDTAWTYVTPGASRRSEIFVHRAWRAFRATVTQVKRGMGIDDIGRIAAASAALEGVAIVPEFVGHGIGRALHEPPMIPFHRGTAGASYQNIELRSGMIVNIEPVYSIGAVDVTLVEDGWGYRLVDGSTSAHFELSLLVDEDETRVLQMGGIPAHELPVELPFGHIVH